MFCLASNAGRVISREQLYEQVWSEDTAYDVDGLVKTHIKTLRKALEQISQVRVLTPHSCRHTYVSQMQALGVDLPTIQSIVGHADIDMTQHYLHVQESIRQNAIQKFSQAFTPAKTEENHID